MYFILPVLEKARKNLKLIPKTVTVTREGTTYETTVWVLPTKKLTLNNDTQFDLFADADIQEKSLKARLLKNIREGTNVTFLENGKIISGMVVYSGYEYSKIVSKKIAYRVDNDDIKSIVPEKRPEEIAKIIKAVTPETRTATEAQLFGADLKEDLPEVYHYEPTRVEEEPYSSDNRICWDFRDVIPVQIGLISEKDILTKEPPSWIPLIDSDERFRSVGNRVEAVKIGDNDYLIRGGAGTVNYARVNLDVLAATQDYYLKRAKALAHNKFEETKAKRRDNGSSDAYVKKHPVRVVGENRAMFTTLEMSTSFMGLRGNARFKPIKAAIDDMKQKLSDMNIQLEENYTSYNKGQQTAYGNSGTKTDLLDKYGVLVKRQNGDAITKKEIGDISTALESIFSVFGNRASMAKSFGLKISHSGTVLMHARKASGIFFPAFNAIGVTMQGGPRGFGFTLSHEWAHFMDNYLGTKSGRHNYASDDWASLPGQIASIFRKSMALPQKSDYQNRTCECFARAMEQYFSYKTGEQDALIAGASKGNQVPKGEFEKNLVPLIDRFFQENNELLKSLTFSGFPLQGRTKIHGMDISIENRKGSVRSGVSDNGHEWHTKMHFAYGYIRGTVGKDKDHLDCYIGPNKKSEKVFIVHQNNPETGAYDEDKVMLGFDDAEQAKKAYLGQYDSPAFFGSMDATDIEAFKGKIFQRKQHGKKLIIR